MSEVGDCGNCRKAVKDNLRINVTKKGTVFGKKLSVLTKIGETGKFFRKIPCFYGIFKSKDGFQRCIETLYYDIGKDKVHEK